MNTMEGWQYSSFDGKLEDALRINPLMSIPTAASLGKDQLLVRVIHAALNPVDYKLPESGIIGKIMITRPATPGLDLCGRIIAKHPSNTAFEEGQLIFGGFHSSNQMGTLQEYIVISTECCTLLPPGVNPKEATAIGTAATTAYQSLKPDTLKPGSYVFINGGSGSVGTWTIQLAKVMGAKVVTSCSTKHVGLCQSLGADEVVDCRTEDVIASLRKKGAVFDLLIDNVGNDPVLYKERDSFIKPGGTFVQVGVGEAMSFKSVAKTVRKQLWPSLLRSRYFYFVNINNAALFFQRIGGWMAEGKVHSVVAAEYSWKEVPEAFRKLRQGCVAGKIIINIGPSIQLSRPASSSLTRQIPYFY